MDSFLDSLSKPKMLYHYTSASTAIEKILPYRTLRLSSIRNTNDPYEYREMLLGAVGWGDITDDKIRGPIKSSEAKINRILAEDFKVLSCCQNSDDEGLSEYRRLGCCKPRMWSQYGARHTGVCFALDLEAIRISLQEQYEYSKMVAISYRKVMGSKRTAIDFNQLEDLGVEKYSKQKAFKLLENLYLEKDIDYQSENEFRIFVYEPGCDFSSLDLGRVAIGILLGDRFPDGLLPSIDHFADTYSLPVKRVRWTDGEPFPTHVKYNDIELWEKHSGSKYSLR